MDARRIRVEDAVGKILSHDVTKIVRGEFKGPAFRKGHLVTEEDIPELLNFGKEQVYVLEMEADEVHEDEAGIRLGRAFAGSGVTCSEPKESRVNLFASRNGLLKVNIPVLEQINGLPYVILSTLPNNTPVMTGEMLAGTKVIPLVVKEKVVKEVEAICSSCGEVIMVEPYQVSNIEIIVTGNEVYTGRIKDTFGPVLREKVEALGSHVCEIRTHRMMSM